MKVQTKVTFTKEEVLALIKEKFPQFKEAEIEIESDDVDEIDCSNEDKTEGTVKWKYAKNKVRKENSQDDPEW